MESIYYQHKWLESRGNGEKGNEYLSPDNPGVLAQNMKDVAVGGRIDGVHVSDCNRLHFTAINTHYFPHTWTQSGPSSQNGKV